MAIAAHIITAQNGQRLARPDPAFFQCFGKIGVNRLGRGTSQLGSDRRGMQIKRTIFIQVIAAFSHRDRHHLYRIECQQVSRLIRRCRGINKPDMRTHKPVIKGSIRRNGFHRITVLCRSCYGKCCAFRLAQIHAGNPPAQIACCLHDIINKDRLMGAVKGAISDMHNTNGTGITIIGSCKKIMLTHVGLLACWFAACCFAACWTAGLL